jgi:hypothetical protein
LGWLGGLMDDFKGKISKKVLDSLTMEDLWQSPRLKKLVEEEYPRAYLAITKPFREFGLYNFIKLAEAQKENVEKLIDLAPSIDDPKKSIEHGIEMIKLNKLKKDTELWIGGVPFKFELSRFVKHYASKRTYTEWRNILKDIGASKSNMERILDTHRRKFKDPD